jgi:acyl-CoA dehydrogenase
VRAALSRVAFGQEIARQGVVREQIAESRMEIEQARLMVLKTADLIDKHGAKGAHRDRRDQGHRAAGGAEQGHRPGDPGARRRRRQRRLPAGPDVRGLRTLRIADGPDEVHKQRRSPSRRGRSRRRARAGDCNGV